MEDEIYKTLLGHLIKIENAIEGLTPNFWLDDNFWMSVISTLVLSLTLFYLILYTKATQEMKNEMIHQRIMSNAHDVGFRLDLYYFKSDLGDSSFGTLKTNEYDTNISGFIFLDHKNNPIGRSTKFYKVMEKDPILKSDYFIEKLEDRTRFLKTLEKKTGKIEALVETSIGDKFIYTYEALQKNWKIVLEKKNLNLSDDFVLIRKRQKQ